MVFSSFLFLFAFLPLALLFYYAVPSARGKNAVLLAFSLLFYSWGEPLWVIVLLLDVLVAWIGGRWIASAPGSVRAKAVLAGSVAFQIAFLVYFKYAGFLLDTLHAITSIRLSVPAPGLPIGVSFFTFHLISYLVDVYRADAPALRSYAKLLLYISLFPQLVAGPIVRYGDIADQLSERRITPDGFGYGVVRFAIGLGKKAVIANALSDMTPTLLDGDPRGMTALGAWVGIFAFALQIYFDFSGYSDMAIGLGHLFGFRIRENFDYPYASRSATEFWRRWNMSVGRFFRDYVYIPLGGNRRRPYWNLLVVWFLTGLWHGASWNFVLWGLYFGALIALEKSILHRLLGLLPAIVSHLYFGTAVLVGWVFFYFPSFDRAASFLRVMFGLTAAQGTNAELAIHLYNHLFLLALAALLATPLPARLHRALSARLKPRLLRTWYANALVPAACLAIMALSALLLVGRSYTPFFYFRF